jgi:hypothetical protein
VAQDTCQNISASYRFTFRRTFLLRRISLHEFPCRHKLEMANTLAKFLNGFRLPLELEDCRKSFEEIVVPGNLGKTTRAILATAGNPASVSCVFPRLTTCAKYFQSKTNRGPSREGPLFRASLRPQLFCEFYLQPVYRQAFTRFQQVLFFSAHFHGRCFARPSFYSLCEPASSDATIEGSINSEPCA